MKYLYQSIAQILENDSDLKKMVDYTEKKLNIRRGYKTDGVWEKLVVYYLQPDNVLDDSVSEKIRIVPLIVRVYDRLDDLNCDDMAERIVLLLDGANLSITDKIHVYDCTYTGELIPMSYNQDLKSNEKVIRFSIKVRMDEIIGKSGLPVRKRQRDN